MDVGQYLLDFLVWTALATVVAVSVYVVAIYAAWSVVWFHKPHALKARVLRALLWEWVCVVLILVFGALTIGRKFARLRNGTPGQTPVLCVHGYTQNFGNFFLIARHLQKAGTGPIFGVNLSRRFGSVEFAAGELAAALRRVQQETGAEKIDVICHSMGGLVTRTALHRHDVATLVRRVVTLGTPHLGTHLAAYGLGANAREMRIQSAFLCGLPPPPPSLTSIWSTSDAMVLPVTNASCGPGDVVFDDLGHLSLLISPRVAQAVVKALTAPEATPDVKTVETSQGAAVQLRVSEAESAT